MTPVLSIVIPCYNDGRHLPEAVASVEACAARPAFECLIVNDGSTDEGTLAEFRRLRERGYRVVDQPNLGLGAARNTGIRLAAGEFILPLDSDNRIRPAYLARGVDVLRAEPEVGVVYGDAEYFGNRAGRWEVAAFSLERMMRGNYIDACAVFRRSAWESVGGYDERMPAMGWEDWDFWLRLALRRWGFRHVPEVLFEYRVRSGSMISSANARGAELLAYMFGKPELEWARLWRERDRACRAAEAALARVSQSRDYRLGRALLAPWRAVKGVLRRSGRPPDSPPQDPTHA